MPRTRLLSLFAIPALALAQSDKIDLFSFVMPGAQLIAGANVETAKNSPFGQFVLSQIPVGEKFLNSFITETGIDPRSDLTEVLAAWNGTPRSNGQWLIGAHGNFGPSIGIIETNALQNGGSITRLPGVDIVAAGQPGTNTKAANVCIGLFTDGFTDVVGDCTSVHAAIEFPQPAGGAASPLVMKAEQLRSQQDIWFASVVPLTQFANAFAGANPGGSLNLGSVLNSNLFQAIQEISGGVKFAAAAQASGAQLSAEVMLDTPQNATSLLNVVKFVVGLLSMNTGTVPAWLAALLGNLEASVNGSVLDIGLNIPESTLEQLFQQVGQLAMNQAPRAYR